MFNNEKYERQSLLQRIPLPPFIKEFVNMYFEYRIARAAAAISFFLTLSVFPFLICVNAMLGSLNLSEETVLRMGHGFLPESTLKTIADYMEYITQNATPAMITAAIILLVSFSSAAYRTIMISMTEMQGKARYSGLFGTIFSFFFSIIFMAVIYVAGIIVISGNWLTNYIGDTFGIEGVVLLWQRMKFLILFLLLFAILLIIYRLNAPKVKPFAKRLVGAVLASLVLVVLSMIFSRIIELTAQYSIVYGSLASVVVLMLWMYLCGNIFLLGNAYNILREKRKK